MTDWLTTRFETMPTSTAEVRICCPMCDDGKFHMYVNPDKESPNSNLRGVAYCFKCGYRRSLLGLIMDVDQCKYGEALVQLTTPTLDVGRFERLRRFEKAWEVEQPVAPVNYTQPTGYVPLAEHTQSMERKAVWKYLHTKRKLDAKIIYKCMGYVPGTHRAWILIDNNWYQGRLIIPGEPKYLSPGTEKGDALWNHSALGRYQHIIIAEGVFSALAIGDNAIALCGKDITKEQALRIIKAKPEALTLMLDHDAIAQMYTIVAQRLLELGYQGKLFIHHLESGDPTDGTGGVVREFNWASQTRFKCGLV